MKHKLLLFAFGLISTAIISQSVPRAFEAWKTKDGTQTLFVKNITKTDGSSNVYTGGATLNASNGTYDIFLVKKNAAGNTLYTKQINGTANTHDFIAGMYLSGTDVYITGTITNSVTNIPELFLAKYNSAGTQQFFTTFSNGYGDIGKDIIINPTYNYIIVAGASYNNNFDSDMLAVVFDSGGNQQYFQTLDYNTGNDGAFKVTTRGSLFTITGPVTQSLNNYKLASQQYSVASGFSSGGVTVGATATSSVEIVSDVVTDGAGNIYICGATQQNAGQGYDYYIAKITSTLSIVWERTFNVSNGDDFAKGIDVDASGQVWVTGVTTHSTQGKNMTTLRLNSSGVIQSTLTVNGTSNGNDEGMDIVLDASGNAYATGFQSISATNSDFYTVKYNSSGTQIWEKFSDGYSQIDQATNVALDSLNNVIVAGSAELHPGELCYLTTKLVQQDVKDPIDLLGQPTNKNYGYHENRGQVRNDTGGTAPSVIYYTHNQYPKVYIEKNSYNYVYTKTDTVASTNDTIERINVGFTGASGNVRPYGYNPKTYPLHYFLGQVGEPITEVRGYDRLVTQNIYPNIDLHYYSNSKGLKYYFVVREGGNPANIQFRINGAISTTITSNNLVINGVVDDVTLKRPYAYMVNGSNVTTTLSAVSWVNTGSDTYEFSVPTYTTSQTLIYVVETVNLATATGSTQDIDYSTYCGKTNNDIFNDIKVTTNGDHYVVGNTDGNTFPSGPGALFTYQGFTDAVVMRFEVTKDSCAFATYYGGAGAEYGNSVDVNSLGEIFIAGRTNSSGSSGIPTFTTSGASGQPNNGMSIAPSGADPNDGFFARFAPNGNGHTWGRYYGGSQEDGINSIFIDNSNNLHFTGYARSNNITMVNAAQSSLSSGGASTNYDAILGKFSSSLAQVYSTYLGGSYSIFTATRDEGRDITVDGSGNAIVVGTTDSNTFPCSNSTGNANTFYDNTFGGARDGFIARYSPTGTKQFASYFGGSDTYGIDEITRVHYNSAKDEIYIAGQSNDTINFPYVNLTGGFNLHRKATNAAFIASMTGNLTKQWCTNYGKAASNFSVTGLASDNAGIIYLAGQAKSSTLNYPVTTPTLTVYKDTVRSADDGFVTIFNPQKNLFHAHYLGGSGNDYINNAYVGTNNKLYVIGNTGSATTGTAIGFPIAYNSVNIQFIDSTFGGGAGQYDGFVTRFDMGTIQIISVKEIEGDDYLLNVYPNPSTNGFTLDMKETELKNVQAKVYNLTGQLIVEQRISQPQTRFYCESWANGVYLINVNVNGTLKTFKLVKD